MRRIIEFLMKVGFHLILIISNVNKLLFYPKIAGKNYKKFKGLLDNNHELYYYYVFRRVSDCSHFSLASPIGAKVMINERESTDNGWTYRFTGVKRDCLNFGSFNYLGFAKHDAVVINNIKKTIKKYGITTCDYCSNMGLQTIHAELEKLTAKFLGVADSIIFTAGFATNSLNLPALLSNDSLVLSDEKNHASMIHGMKLSSATIVQYRHVDYEDLENKLISYLSKNLHLDGKFFSRIIIAAEGIYSMDGTIVDLPKLIHIKNKYKAYLYIDDAHGVGVLGKYGRGICDYHNVDPSNVDVLMGTYSKAFASNGGFIAGKKSMINFLRSKTYANYGATMSSVAASKAISSITTLMEHDQTNGNGFIRSLHEKTVYLRQKLLDGKFNISGKKDSHIVPLIVGTVSSVSFSIRVLQKENIAVSGVIFPATPLLAGRLRFNVCACHSYEQLDELVATLKKVNELYGLNFCSSYFWQYTTNIV